MPKTKKVRNLGSGSISVDGVSIFDWVIGDERALARWGRGTYRQSTRALLMREKLRKKLEARAAAKVKICN